MRPCLGIAVRVPFRYGELQIAVLKPFRAKHLRGRAYWIVLIQSAAGYLLGCWRGSWHRCVCDCIAHTNLDSAVAGPLAIPAGQLQSQRQTPR